MKQWFIGTIGFSYKDWVGPFYPPGTTQRGYLPYYSKRFNSVEIDTTFHAIPRQSNVLTWFNLTPPEFKFCLKTPKIITHELGLSGAEGLMLEFLDSIHSLGQKLGPILIQLPPRFSQENYYLLEKFIDQLPEQYQYAIEFRHNSWFNQKTTDLLANYRVCWVSIDYPHLPKEITRTTDFLYIRWIGINNYYHHHSYERVDKSAQLKEWFALINSMPEEVGTIYGYFNNDYAGFAAGTGLRFKQTAGLGDQEDDILQQERFL